MTERRGIQVETYEAISIDESGGQFVNEEVSEEALALIEALGLDGQKALLQERRVSDGETTVTRNPYRRMTGEEQAVFGAILPRHVEVSAYEDGPIPLRVLQVAAHAKPMFNRVVVWCPAEPSQPDPLLVGVMKNRERTWVEDVYILARWGDVLEPLDVMREKAQGIIVSRCRAEIAKARAKITQFESSLETGVASYLQGGTRESEFLPNLTY